MELELVSFKLCPFVQRVAITLLHRQMSFRLSYIDPDTPPDWFLEASPFGKVPLLKVDDTVLFESAVINEFVDEVAPGPRMQPADPLSRALNRAWVEVASACIGDHYALITGVDETSYKRARAALREKLERLDEALGEGPYFNGSELMLVDTAFAPLFLRMGLLADRVPIYSEEEFPRVSAWSRALRALPAVRDSVVPEFPELYLEYVRGRHGFAESLLQ